MTGLAEATAFEERARVGEVPCIQQRANQDMHRQAGQIMLCEQDIQAHAQTCAVHANLGDHAGLAEREVAKAIVMIMENTYMTGTTIDVDGGVLLP